MVDRSVKISEEMKREISTIIRDDVKDPRLKGMTSIIAVKATRDLRYATVYISVLGTDEEKKEALAALKSAAGFIRREVGHRMEIRYTPELLFELDNSIEHGIYISNLINKTLQSDK